MREAGALVLLSSVLACAEPSELEPRTPVRAALHDPVCVQAPALEDSFAEARARYEGGAYHAEPPRSVDLGAIGDAPLGRNPTPPHRVPAWQQPFPCDWTHTCRQAPALRLVTVVPMGVSATGDPIAPE